MAEAVKAATVKWQNEVAGLRAEKETAEDEHNRDLAARQDQIRRTRAAGRIVRRRLGERRHRDRVFNGRIKRA